MAAETFIAELKSSAEYVGNADVRAVVDPLITQIEQLPQRGMEGKLGELLTELKRKLRGVLRKSLAPPATLEEVDQIMGPEHFFGSGGIYIAFGANVPPEAFPPFPPKEELERHAAKGHTLRLRVNSAGGSPLTMVKMIAFMNSAFVQKGNGVLLADPAKNVTEFYFSRETPRAGWVFTTDEIVPGSLGKDYIAQTQIIADYVRSLYGDDLPDEYEDAIREWDRMSSSLYAAAKNTKEWPVLVDVLSKLALTKLRPAVADVFFDFLQTFCGKVEKKRLLEKTLTWTSSQHSKGTLLMAGTFDKRGAMLDPSRPLSPRGNCGVTLAFPYPDPFGTAGWKDL